MIVFFLAKNSSGFNFFYDGATLCFLLLNYCIHSRKEETLGLAQVTYI